MEPVRVQKTPLKAFDKTRPASELLMRQIEHLRWASLPASKRKPRQLRKIRRKTEGAAAKEIEKLTKLVLEQQAAGYVPPPPKSKPSRRKKARRKAR